MDDLTVKCEKCGGSGSETFEEDGRNVTDMCYRCAGSGRVDSDTAHRTRMEYVAAILGDAAVRRERKNRDSDPEGEGWAFCAAENMMSVHDYTLSRRYEMQAEVGEELTKLSLVAQLALIEALLPKKEEKEEMPPSPATPEPGSFDDCDVAGHSCDNDIPF